MTEMTEWMEANVSVSAAVLLFADGWARELFIGGLGVETEGEGGGSVGMARMV